MARRADGIPHVTPAACCVSGGTMANVARPRGGAERARRFQRARAGDVRRHGAADRLRLRRGSQLGAEGRGAVRHGPRLAPPDTGGRGLQDSRGRAARHGGFRPPARPQADLRDRHDGHREQRRDGRPRRARRFLRGAGALVPRGRCVRRARAPRPRRWRPRSRESSAPTRWRSTCTSGCTCPSKWRACSCATARCTRRHSQ